MKECGTECCKTWREALLALNEELEAKLRSAAMGPPPPRRSNNLRRTDGKAVRVSAAETLVGTREPAVLHGGPVAALGGVSEARRLTSHIAHVWRQWDRNPGLDVCVFDGGCPETRDRDK